MPIASATEPASSARASLRVGAALVLLAVLMLAYAPALNGGRLWDDDAHLTPPELQSWQGLGRIWSEIGATQQYYPVLYSAFWLEHRLWGDAMAGYHIVNVFWHGLAALLVVAVVRRLLGFRTAGAGAVAAPDWTYRAAPWLAGAVFALHPVAVESVAWVSEQKNTLSAVFALAAVYVWLGREAGSEAGAATRRHWQPYALASVWFGLALLTKTVTATIPAVLLVIAWWRRGRIDGREVRLLAPWFAAGVVAGGMTAWVERTVVGAEGTGFELSLLDRGLLASRALWFYAAKLVWPVNLMFVYPHWRIDAAVGWQWAFPGGLLAVLVWLVLRARTDRAPLATVLVFAGVLFPALGFVDVFPFLYSYVADHFQYLASLGLIVPGSVLLVRTARRLLPGRAPVAVTAGACLLGTLTLLTWRQTRIYRDSETLYRATLARNPNASMAHNNLGELLDRRGQREEARSHFEAAVRADPRNAPAHTNLGRMLAADPNRLPDAIAEYEAALRLQPKLAEAHTNLGLALTKLPNRQAEALKHLAEAVRLAPESAGMRDNLGATLLAAGRVDEAIAELALAVKFEPGNALYHGHLAVALAGVPDRNAEALVHFEAASRLDPDNAPAHSNLGAMLAQMPGRSADALAEFRRAVALDPGLVEAQYAIGVLLLETTGDRAAARAQFERVLQLEPGHPRARQALQQIDRGLSGR